ncbi:hypothetical protein B0H10DRAFT_2240910 [Mycena sp. CBHHK59/15]|nr:hypothetical protein B0H10DRAFT_2240910 [Mycena sp. CBHHK59/15]
MLSNLCTEVEDYMRLHEKITRVLQDPNHHPTSPEAAALKRLQESGTLQPVKRRKTQVQKGKPKDGQKKPKDPAPVPKTDEELDEIADKRLEAILPTRLAPPHSPQELLELLKRPRTSFKPEDEESLFRGLLRGFSSPDGDNWSTILTADGLHSKQRTTIQTATAAAAAEDPTNPKSLVDSENSILAFQKSTRADSYAADRILLAELIRTQPAWLALTKSDKGIHNRDLFILQHPTHFPIHKTREEHHQMLTQNNELETALRKWTRSTREPLTRARNQIYNLYLVFGMAAIIHPAVSLDTIGRKAESLSRLSIRMPAALCI